MSKDVFWEAEVAAAHASQTQTSANMIRVRRTEWILIAGGASSEGDPELCLPKKPVNQNFVGTTE
jgi:hypothetical protein